MKNVEWEISQNKNGKYSLKSVQIALLQDIRNELATLNSTLKSIKKKLPKKAAKKG